MAVTRRQTAERHRRQAEQQQPQQQQSREEQPVVPLANVDIETTVTESSPTTRVDITSSVPDFPIVVDSRTVKSLPVALGTETVPAQEVVTATTTQVIGPETDTSANDGDGDMPAANNTSDHRGQRVQVGTRAFAAQVTFDDISTADIKRVVQIPWFDRAAVIADAEVDFRNPRIVFIGRGVFLGHRRRGPVNASLE